MSSTSTARPRRPGYRDRAISRWHKADEAILRVHDKVRANLDRIPIGIPEPLIIGRGINDVAIMVLTLSPKPEAAERWNDNELYHLAEKLRIEVAKVDNTGFTYIIGGGADQISVEPDPERLALYGVTLQQLVDKVKAPTARSWLAQPPAARRAGGSGPDACTACRISAFCSSPPATGGPSMCATSPRS